MISANEITSIVALHFNVEASAILSQSQNRATILPRHIAFYLARKELPISDKDIGRIFGRDRTTIIQATNKISDLMTIDPQLSALISALQREIEYRAYMEGRGPVDVLAVARRIAQSPTCQAIGATVMEIVALATTIIDLWEVVEAGEALIDMGELESSPDMAIREIAASIKQTLAALCGPQKEHDNEC